MSVEVDTYLKQEMLHEMEMDAMFDQDDMLVEHIIDLEQTAEDNKERSLF